MVVSDFMPSIEVLLLSLIYHLQPQCDGFISAYYISFFIFCCFHLEACSYLIRDREGVDLDGN